MKLSKFYDSFLFTTMDFKNISVTQFCTSIYELYELPFGYDYYSSIDMYLFIKQKTNGFEKDLFDYLIRDLRDFYRFVEFEIKNPNDREEVEIEIDGVTGYPTTASLEDRDNYNEFLTCNIDNLPVYYKSLYGNLLVFNDRQTLREKINIIEQNIPEILFFCHHIKELLDFSDIAENEYEKAKKRQRNKINSYKTAKDILKDLSSKEFIQYCFRNDLPSLEIYNYIQTKTGDFDAKKVRLFINEIYRFNETVPIYVTESKEFNGIITTEEVKYYLIGYLNSFRLKNYENADLKDLLDEIDSALIRPDLNLALKVARKINPKIRISLEYNSFVNILNILEDNVKEELNQNVKTTGNSNFPLPQSTDQVCSRTNSSLTLAEVALICYYLGYQITKDNADDYLKKFYIEATTKSIIEKYNYYQKKNNRIHSKGKKANDFHLKRLENVVKYLKENNFSFEEAENDLKIFQKNME